MVVSDEINESTITKLKCMTHMTYSTTQRPTVNCELINDSTVRNQP